MIRITVVAGNETFIYDWEADAELKVGRLESNQLAIPHSDVSRTHFSIEPGAGGTFKVRDLGSRNGTRINGTPTVVGEVRVGDEITIGPDVVLYFGGAAPAKVDVPKAAAPARRPKDESGSDEKAAKPGKPEKAGKPANAPPPPPLPDDDDPGRKRAAEKEKAAPAGEAPAAPPPAPALPAAAAPTSEGAKPAPAAPAVAVVVRRPRRRARTAGGVATLLGILIFLAGMGYGGYVLFTVDGETGSADAAATGAGAADAAEVRAPGPVPDIAIDRSKPLPGRRPAGEDAKEWQRLSSLDLKGDLLESALEQYTLKYPSSPHAADAHRRLESIRRVKDGGGPAEPGKASPALESEILMLIRSESFSEAHYLASVAPRLGAADETAAQKLKKNVEKAAYDRFAAVRERGRELLKAGKPFDAYDFVATVALPLKRMPFYAEVESELAGLKRSVATALERGGPRAEPVVASGERAALDRLLPEARRAIATCDFETALDRYRQILALPLTDEERLEFQWKMFDARRAKEIWQRLIDRVCEAPDPAKPKPPITVTVYGNVKGEVIEADRGGLKVRVILPDEKNRPLIEKRWKEVPPVWVLEMFRGLDFQKDGDGLLALAAYCFEADDETEAHTALVKIVESLPAYRAEVSVLLRRRTGVDIPPDQLIVHDGRVTSVAERDAAIARAAEAKAEAKRLAEELAAAKREEHGRKYYDRAIAMLEAGQFVDGRAVLAAVAKKFKDDEIGKQAKARYEDAFLRRRTLKRSGREENRVNIHFLAEGYTCEKDEEQRMFDFTADRTLKFLEKAEPWVEYAGYFNYFSQNLRSNDRGISREPGGIKKDTPCGGMINGSTFTVDNAKARSWVQRFPGNFNQAICIGNDNASVATGGGGAVAVVKGMIDVTGHEIGHSFGGLLDEYDFDPGGGTAPPAAPGPIPTEVLGPNVIKGNQKDDLRAKAPWAHWIAIGTANWTGKIVDIFEGASQHPKDHWRPQADCKMRSAGSPFCCVCMERMIIRIYENVRPIDEVEPKDEKLEITADQPLDLFVTCLRPKSRPLDVKWEVKDVADTENPDGSTVVRDGKARVVEGKSIDLVDPNGGPMRHKYGCRLKNLKPGLYDVTVTISDPTVWVLQKDRSMLEEKRTWRVRVRENR